MMIELKDRFKRFETRIQSPDFLQNKGHGNEVRYYIFDYLAKDELSIRERIEDIRKRNTKGNDRYKLIVFDLYEIMIEILENKGFLEKCFELEKGLQKVCTAVSNLMRVNSLDGLIVEYIKKKITDEAIVLLIGIGKCYPIIRSHTILNNLHQVVDDVPVIMFYPGIYSGQDLMLFGEIKDDNYYRAFKFDDWGAQ